MQMRDEGHLALVCSVFEMFRRVKQQFELEHWSMALTRSNLLKFCFAISFAFAYFVRCCVRHTGTRVKFINETIGFARLEF
uniref:Uncharacterized protein n=1 Tax=Strigamia maritima TaxID=126957 RepID=T1IXR8_STRMM